jgi:hypothetical protein
VGPELPAVQGLAGSTGELLVQYEKQLSIGAVGSIWLGRLASGAEAGRLVIARRIPLALLDASDVDRIRHSVGAYVRLKSPSLVKLLDVAIVDRDLVCVSEYLAGVRLHDLQRCLVETEASIPTGVAVRLVLEVAKAGVIAHRLMSRLGILASHRVVFGDSVLVALFGETLLTDVGILAGLLRCPNISSNPSVILGLAPEEILAPEGTYGSPEVFTLGVLLWELLTSRWLFSRHLDTAASRNALTRQPIAPIESTERVGLPVPETVARVLGQAIGRDPRTRYGSLEVLIDALEQLPSHCVASIEQLGDCIRSFAPQILPECDNSAIWPLDAERVRTFTPSTPPISLGPGNAHDWDPPTFAERQLVAPVFDNEELTENAAEPVAPVLAQSLPVFQPVPPKRSKAIVIGSALVLVAAVALTLSFLLQRRASAIAKATADTARSVAAEASVNSQIALPEVQEPTAAGLAEASSPKEEATVEPPKNQDQKIRTAPSAKKSTSKVPAVNSQTEATSSEAYRPHKILPFHPKGI